MRAISATALLVMVALAGCTGDASKDSDDDGIYDREEKAGWSIFVDLMGARIQRDVTSDPDKRDTDGDGLRDQDEFFLLSDPSNADTDGDGLSDCQEVKHTVLEECEDPSYSGPFDGGYQTSASNADSDHGPTRYVANHPYDDQTGSIKATISWGDGISDGDEVFGYDITLPGGGTKRVTSDPTDADSDDDMLEDGEEALLYGGDPTDSDTDNDGCIDGKDPFPGRAESYSVGLQNFRLIAGKDPGGSADVFFHVVFLGDNGRPMPSSGHFSMAAGDTVDLTGINGPDRTLNCTMDPFSALVTPWSPWLLIQVIAYDRDANSRDLLDITSNTDSKNHEIWWNVREDRFAWERGGADFAGPVILEGANGRLVLQPTS